MIELHGVSTGGGASAALADLDLLLSPGGAAAVGGGAGAGKSQLAAIAAARQKPRAGSARILGVETTALRGARLAGLRRRIGYAAAAPEFFEDERVFDNVGMPLWLAGLPAPEVARAAEAALGEVGLIEAASARAGSLSSGQRRRAALARALVAEPEVVVADDPIAGLDLDGATLVMTVLEAARERGAAVLTTSAEPRLHSGARHLGWARYELREGVLARLQKRPRAPVTRAVAGAAAAAPGAAAEISAPAPRPAAAAPSSDIAAERAAERAGERAPERAADDDPALDDEIPAPPADREDGAPAPMAAAEVSAGGPL